MDRERINLIVHQYLGTVRDSMVACNESGTDYVASMPGFDTPATVNMEKIPDWIEALSEYMDELL